jgi:tetratricopeptide (TPR) repeat protein
VELLSGHALGPGAEPGAPLARAAVFGIDATMRAFVAAQIGDSRDAAARLRRLLLGMKERGFFALEYDETLTRTASATFYDLEGNCLSFTILFVALAREAGLDVTYQTVDMPPSWSRESDLVIVTHHINALINTGAGRSYVVDFNVAGYRDDRQRQAVDDDHVLALFYNNLGAEALIRQDYETSFRYLRAALTADPQAADAWVNLGVLYRRQGLHEHAKAAYLHALAANQRLGSALSNLAKLEADRGNHAQAAEYQERIRHHQKANPYYHYVVAREAFDEQRFDDALTALRHAVRLKRDEPAFHELRNLARQELAGGAAARELDAPRSYADAATPIAER